MPIELIDKIIPKNNAKFKLIDAKNVAINGSDVENYFQKIEILIDETKKEITDISRINTHEKIEEANEKNTKNLEVISNDLNNEIQIKYDALSDKISTTNRVINNNQAIFEEEKVKLKQNIDDLNLNFEKNKIITDNNLKELTIESSNNKIGIDGLHISLTQINKNIENNKTELEGKNAELKTNIDKVSSSLSSVSNTVDKNNKTLVAKTNTLEQNLNGLSQTVASNKTVTDGKITSVEDETHELKAGLGGLTSELNILKSTTDGINKTVNSQGSDIKQLEDSINLKVDSSTFSQTTKLINSNIDKAKADAKTYSDTLGQQLKVNAEKYANNVAIAKSELAKQQAIANADGKINAEEQKRIAEAQDNLNTAITKADKAKQDAITEANRVAELKKNEALNNAKAYTNAEITTVNTKVHNLESGIDILKDQIKSKVSQSDIDLSISTVENKIKLVDTKISDVSSNVTQSKDNVTTQINSINSKTQSIESNLNGKANKQEIVDLNSKVVDITANLSGITQKVSATETFTKSLNNKLLETTNKLNNVEQQLTPTSIINTVASAYYKKGEVDNVFSTKSQVEQLDNRINYKFSNTGYSNLIFNGNFANGTVHWKNWGNCSLVVENGQLLVRAKQNSNNASIGAVSSTFVLEKGKKYSLTFQGCSSWNIPWLNYVYLLGEDGINHRLDLKIDINSSELVYRTATFTAPATKWVRLLIGAEGYLQTDISGFKLVDVCLVEGDIPRRFVPNANEISKGATSIDSNGVIVRFADNSYVSMTHGGFAWKTETMTKPYYCLTETGWVNISTGVWFGDHYDIKITLPEYFRGKVFTPCSMIQGWYVEGGFALNQLVVNIPYDTINYSEGNFIIRVKALTTDGKFQSNVNISWLVIA